MPNHLVKFHAVFLFMCVFTAVGSAAHVQIFGLRLPYYQIMALLLFVSPLVDKNIFNLRPIQKNLVWLIAAVCVARVASGAPLLLAGAAPLEWGQFMRGVGASFLDTIGLLSLVLLKVDEDKQRHQKLISYFIMSIGVTIIFQMSVVISFVVFGVGIEGAFWAAVNLGSDRAFESKNIGIITTFPRTGALAGNPNVLGLQLLFAWVVVWVRIFQEKRQHIHFAFAIAITVSLLLCVSKSAHLSLVIVNVVLLASLHLSPLVQNRGKLVWAIIIIVGCSAATIAETLYVVFPQQAQSEGGVATSELDDETVAVDSPNISLSNSSSSRFRYLDAGLDIVKNRKLVGVGYNVSSVSIQDYEIGQISGANLHNYWLILLVELGVLAVPNVIFLLYCTACLGRSRPPYSRVFLGLALSVAVAGLFNNALQNFIFQALIVSFVLGFEYRTADWDARHPLIKRVLG